MAKKTILCAIDFSESSLHAMKWTLAMAQMYHAQVTFLFCYRLIDSSGVVESLQMKRDMETSALARFHEIEKKLITATTVPYQFISEVGFCSSRIEQFIRKTPIEMLVIGNSMVENLTEHKNSGFGEFLTSLKVPVVIAPTGIDDFVEAGSTLHKS